MLVLFKAIQLGSKIYHEEESMGVFYDQCLNKLAVDVGFSETITDEEVERIRLFVNRWGTRCQWTVEQLTDAINSVQPELSALNDLSIFNIDFQASPQGEKESFGGMIEYIFECIATCAPNRRETTGASKVLHMLNPELFVMWDERIRAGYSSSISARSYAKEFLVRIQKVINKAIREAEAQLNLHQNLAIEKLCQCGHTLAKVIDEYNYVKYTWSRVEVWDEEYS